ncbi:MAG TPA: hypothetical protein VGQ33_09440 [Vicinamibacteria bacterium]|nr:hypothetical protein [Vicinamibacteria bacterium]
MTHPERAPCERRFLTPDFMDARLVTTLLPALLVVALLALMVLAAVRGGSESALIQPRGKDWEKLSPAEIEAADRPLVTPQAPQRSFEEMNTALLDGLRVALKGAGCLVVGALCLYAIVKFIKWAWYS